MTVADARADCAEGSEEEIELKANIELIEAYEEKRWPLGKEAGGKGEARSGDILWPWVRLQIGNDGRSCHMPTICA